MTQNEVIDLMRSSKNEREWGINCDKVKAAFDGSYPPFWWESIIVSGLMDRTLGPGSSQIKIVPLDDFLNRKSE